MIMTIRVDVQHACTDKNLPGDRALAKWARKALQNKGTDRELTIRIVDEDESAMLNERWRNKSGPTNVLSFPFDGDQRLAPGLLGDIIICAPVVRREAEEQQKTLEAHWAHMVIHGTLHLQGYDHMNDRQAEEMESLEIRLLDSLGYTNPYLVNQPS
ncbi:MAG TPA: rRNA maturation RNase YbeY [Gammaproteobacteria bacterium]|nr:rRNA maturation RNase YbeY [Gammaproteobacteria bacterium]